MSLTLVLAGCSKSSKNNSAAESAPSSGASTDSTPPSTESATPDKPAETVTLKWATPAGQEEVDRYIKAFEATHPNIKVVKDTSVDWPWNEKLAAVAAAGELPDVMFTFGVPFAAANGWLEDLTPYLEADTEYSEGRAYKNIVATANYNGKQFALPHALFIFGVYLNLDLFAKENVPIPPVNWTIDDMRDAAIKLTKFNDHQFGAVGLGGMRETIPSAFDPNLNWNTWDGEKFNFTSRAYKEAFDYVDELLYSDKVSYEIYKQEDIEKWFGKDQWPWMTGKIGMSYDATWNIGTFNKDAKFKFDIRPLPSATGQRIPLIADYMAMSKSSKHKKEAFEFLKFITYSKAGWTERMKPEWPLDTVPLINDEEVWNTYMTRADMPDGMKELIKMIPDGFVDPLKWLPGYLTGLDKIFGPTMKEVTDKKVKLEDIAADLEKRMNNAYKDENDQLKALQ